MSRRTIKGELLAWWRLRVEISYAEAKDEYLRLSREIYGPGLCANPEYVGMGLTRLLKKNGTKLGKPGSRALWKFGTDEPKREETVGNVEEAKGLMGTMERWVRDIVRDEIGRIGPSPAKATEIDTRSLKTAVDSYLDQVLLGMIRDHLSTNIDWSAYIDDDMIDGMLQHAVDNVNWRDIVDLASVADEVIESIDRGYGDLKHLVRNALKSMLEEL